MNLVLMMASMRHTDAVSPIRAGTISTPRSAPRVLIVSASAGSGHVSAARALQSAFDAAGRVQAVHVDVLDLAPRWVRAAYGGGFELLAARAPGVWREVYRRSDGTDVDEARWGALARRLIFRAFHRVLTAEDWTVCACTHFLPAQLAAGSSDAPPFASVVTDFTLHRYWVQPRVQQYYVPAPQIALDLHARLPAARVVATGIPIAPAFGNRIAQVQARSELGLAQGTPVLVAMGGGLGIGIEEAVHAALDSGVPDLQVVAVCGRNAAARERLSALGLNDRRLRVLGHTDAVPALFAAADAIVTKPGGLTCTEALAAGRPLVLTRAIPGHEEGNVQYLTSCGAAVHAPDSAAVVSAVRNLLLNPSVLAEYTARALGAGTPAAAGSIAADLTWRFTRTSAA